MNILNVSKNDGEVVVTLSADELVKLSNVLYKADEEQKNSLYYKLYSEVILARDLCQYGHIDNFSLERIVACRNSCGKGLNSVLSKDDIETFIAYIEGNDMPTAFGNTDWCNVFSKIVGEVTSEKIKEWIDS